MSKDSVVPQRKWTIVMVDDNIASMAAGKAVLKDKFEVFTVPSAKKFFLLMQVVKPDLILLDIEMPETNGYTIFRQLIAENEDFDIPVIFLTARNDPGSELEGLSLGAADYISKPFSPPLLIKRIENTLLISEQRNELKRFNENLREMIGTQTAEIMELQSSILEVISELVEFRDNFTGGHIKRTGKLLEILLDAMVEQGVYAAETEKWERNLLLQSALLHDVGKIGIPDLILGKPGKLTSDERAVMERHVEIGEQIIRRIRQAGEDTLDHSFLTYAEILVSFHHERWDGSGYPRGLAGEEIPLLGRLMAVVDVFDALISKRPYKEAMSISTAQKIMLENSGAHFDPQLIDLFMSTREKIYALISTGDGEAESDPPFDKGTATRNRATRNGVDRKVDFPATSQALYAAS
ncbi:MAG: response regulator [Coriobacteriales bacterium]|jgi:putative two-component system response regulator|nr:response regulator [Coriobacteriales bacterium]